MLSTATRFGLGEQFITPCPAVLGCQHFPQRQVETVKNQNTKAPQLPRGWGCFLLRGGTRAPRHTPSINRGETCTWETYTEPEAPKSVNSTCQNSGDATRKGHSLLQTLYVLFLDTI